MKNQDAPTSLSVAASRKIEVSAMLNWIVPTNLTSDAKDSDEPIVKRERDKKLYELTGFVRLIKLETDCDFHVQVAQSADSGSPQVIVEIPRKFYSVQQQLMSLLGMKDGQSSKTWATKPPPHIRFVGFGFLDQTHQSNPPTQEGTGHGPAGVVRTLWELHPVVQVKAAGQ